MPPGYRQEGVTNTQRTALRQHSARNPSLTQNQLKTWFEAQFNRSITQPTVSASLSPIYDYLDDSTQNVEPLAKRRRAAQYPELEEALKDWMQQTQGVCPITEEAVRAQATLLFRNMAQYHGLKMPVFSRTWFQSFRRRQNIESGIERPSPTPSQDNSLQGVLPVLAWKLPLDDIYFCDQASLLWKLMPHAKDFTDPSLAETMNKFKLTALLCSNATGMARLPIWFIGDEEELASMDQGRAQFHGIAPDCRWRHDTSASITSSIFAEWLTWFDEQADERPTLLLLASRDAHTSAAEAISSGGKAPKNTTIAWLTFEQNDMSSALKMDPDIVDIFQTYYAQQWLTHILAELEAQRDLSASMNLLQAVQWSVNIWSQIQPSSIMNSFYTGRIWDRIQSDQSLCFEVVQTSGFNK